MVVKKVNNYTTNSSETTIIHFYINKTFVKLANVYIAPHTPAQEIYYFVQYITHNIHQNEHIVIIVYFNFNIMHTTINQKIIAHLWKSISSSYL